MPLTGKTDSCQTSEKLFFSISLDNTIPGFPWDLSSTYKPKQKKKQQFSWRLEISSNTATCLDLVDQPFTINIQRSDTPHTVYDPLYLSVPFSIQIIVIKNLVIRLVSLQTGLVFLHLFIWFLKANENMINLTSIQYLD